MSTTPTGLAAYEALHPWRTSQGLAFGDSHGLAIAEIPRLRHALYMATLSASRHNPMIRVFYQRLRDAGKPIKVARCAAAPETAPSCLGGGDKGAEVRPSVLLVTRLDQFASSLDDGETANEDEKIIQGSMVRGKSQPGQGRRRRLRAQRRP